MSKYKSVRTVIDGVSFASKAEAAHYQHLKMLERAGLISGLILQPKFPLVVEGTKICTYIADFGYYDREEKYHIDDVKGMRTVVYSLKAKLFHALYKHYRITEIH